MGGVGVVGVVVRGVGVLVGGVGGDLGVEEKGGVGKGEGEGMRWGGVCLGWGISGTGVGCV